ncbi:MAG: hypothetical protein WAT93_00490 [Pontixanthobacter sp.]
MILEELSHRWVYLSGAMMVLVGAALCWHGYSIPVYTDQALASSLKTACWRGDPRSIQELGDAVRSLRTARHDFIQGGLSLILMSLTVVGLFRLYPASKGRGIVTPPNPRSLITLGMIANAIFWIGLMHSSSLDLDRGDVIDCGGPATAFVYFASIAMGLFSALLVYLIGNLIVMRLDGESASLLAWDNESQSRSILMSLVFGILTCLAIWAAAEAATSSSFAVTPACILFAYIFLSTRASWLASHAAV